MLPTGLVFNSSYQSPLLGGEAVPLELNGSVLGNGSAGEIQRNSLEPSKEEGATAALQEPVENITRGC